MRFARSAAAAAVLFGISLLAACGGGGGSTTPTVNPPGPPPVTSSPSAHPSTTPSQSSTPSPTPSPTPTHTPTPTPSPTPTPASTSTPPPSQMTIQVGQGQINGTDDQILSSAPNSHKNTGEGDLMPGDPGALPSGGGQGSAVDGIPTATTMSDNFHIHAFLGLIVNGQEIAIPDGIGMVNSYGDFNDTDACTGGSPQNPSAGANNWECYADGFYYMHTHDPSGVIHMEAPSPVCGKAANWNPPCNVSLFTLGNFLDIWGISSSATNFGAYTGPVTVYTANLGKYAPCTTSPCYTPSNTYALYTGDPRSIPLYSHTVVWIIVGTPPAHPAADLPNIEWDISQ